MDIEEKITLNKKKSTMAQRLKTLRAEYDLTQAEVAKKLGISQQTYSKYENSSTLVDSDTLIALCKLYGVSADYLLGLDGKRDNPPVAASQCAFTANDEEIEFIVNRVLSKMNEGRE